MPQVDHQALDDDAAASAAMNRRAASERVISRLRTKIIDYPGRLGVNDDADIPDFDDGLLDDSPQPEFSGDMTSTTWSPSWRATQSSAPRPSPIDTARRP